MHEETFEKRCRMTWLADARPTCRCRAAAVDARDLAPQEHWGAEALGVTVDAGAALVYSARVMDAFKEYRRAASPHE
jgi:hypothetical protein